MQRFVIGLLFALFLILDPCGCAVAAGKAADSPSPEPVTTADPDIPVDELELLLKPLTKSQLLIEAEAWQALVQAKAEQISHAEITVKHQNQELEKTEQIKEDTAKAKEQLEEVKRLAEEVRETGDAEAVTKAEEAAREAREQMDQVRASVDEAAKAAAKTAEMQEQMPDDIKRTLDETADAADTAEKAVDKVGKTVDDAKGKTGEALRIAADQARTATDQAVEATQNVTEKASKAADATRNAATVTDTASSIESAEAVLERAKLEKKEQKFKLLDELAELRNDRTVLLDQFKAVIAALEVKTDENDTETLATIRDYKLYASAVSGIEVDVKDVTSTWLAIKTWVLSEEGGQRWGLNIMTFAGILIATWIISGIFSSLIHRAIKRVPNTSRLLEDFLVKVARWVVLAIGLIMALAALEVSVGPLLAVVGAAGFAIAFALQDSLSNFASGLMIMFFKPFDVGHFVEAGGVAGKVDSVNLVSTAIMTYDNRLKMVPNNKVWRDVITNASTVTERRVDMEFRIGIDDDIEKAEAILKEIINAHPKVLEKPAPKIRMDALDESSVTFIVRPWVKRAHRLGVKWDITREVKKRFDAAGIGGPYPQRKVHLYLKDADKPAVLTQAANDGAAAPKNSEDGLTG